jgi:histone acetyltransferase 1
VATGWTPSGKLHSTIKAPDGIYEVWKGSLAEAGIKQLVSRIQIFVPLFIEGGSYIGRDVEGNELDNESDAARWTIFFLYRKSESPGVSDKSSYVFVGYSTIYRFFYFQPPTPPSTPPDDWDLPSEPIDLSQLPCRSRLSQFVILPPFQGKGIGARLYNTIFQYYLNHPQTRELTIEDPNEAFDDLRDLCDLTYLRTLPGFANLKINSKVAINKIGPAPKDILDVAEMEKLRQQAKIAPRQFARVTEMHLMSKLASSVRPGITMGPPTGGGSAAQKHEYKLWQLLVKQRIYRQNKDTLGQLEIPERVEKLEETVRSVEFEYARLLEKHSRISNHSVSDAANGKRKLVDDGAPGSSYKKARFDDE